jgi:hypothetical protein
MGLEAQEPSCLSLGRGQAELPPVALEVGEGWKLRGRGGNPADSKNQDNSAVEESLIPILRLSDLRLPIRGGRWT